MTLNSDKPWPEPQGARQRVLHIQRKLHQWSRRDPEKRFDDLFDLVYDRATLWVAWERIRSNRGSKTAGVDGVTRWKIENRIGVESFLEDLRDSLKSRQYRPNPVREHGIPKKGGKVRYLGIPTIRDRVAQMALKLLLEPIFEVDFCPTSYGYRPTRRAQDAIAEVARFINPPSSYEYIVEGDIKACFDNVHHGRLLRLVRQRITDRKVVELIRGFLKAGVMRQGSGLATTLTGTPQGGIISPLLANIYLSVLDGHFERAWKHQTRYTGCTTYYRRRGQATYRLVRYADDFVILVRGTRAQAEAIRDEAACLIQDELKMELSMEKTLVTHVADGFDFLGHHIRRVSWNGKEVAWTFPSKKSLAAIQDKIKSLTTRSTTYLSLKALLYRINQVLRGWAIYFRYAASKRTFAYVDHFTWWRIARWLRKKHPKRNWKYLRQRYCNGGWHFRQVESPKYQWNGTAIAAPRSYCLGWIRRNTARLAASLRASGTTFSTWRDCKRLFPVDIGNRREPDARKRARPVRRTAEGNGAGEIRPPRLPSILHLKVDRSQGNFLFRLVSQTY